MKRYRALLMAMVLMMRATVGTIAIAEDDTTSEDTAEETVEEEVVEEADDELFEDGEWVTIDTMSAEVYLPGGWTVTASDETTCSLADEEGTSTLTITLSTFEGEDLESYLDEQGTEYELGDLTDRSAAVVTGESDVTVLFVQDDGTMVTMVFAPADEGGIADSALDIADTFYIYTVEEEATDEEATEEEAAEEETAE